MELCNMPHNRGTAIKLLNSTNHERSRHFFHSLPAFLPLKYLIKYTLILRMFSQKLNSSSSFPVVLNPWHSLLKKKKKKSVPKHQPWYYLHGAQTIAFLKTLHVIIMWHQGWEQRLAHWHPLPYYFINRIKNNSIV